MSVLPTGLTKPASGEYTIDNSCRVETGNVVNEGMYYTPTEDGSGAGKKFTFSCWVKRAELGSTNAMVGTGTVDTDYDDECFRFSGDALHFTHFAGASGTVYSIKTTAKFRDPSAWYHCVASVDTTDSTAANRVKLYVNGEYQSSLSETSYPPQDFVYKYCMQHMQTIGGRPNTLCDGIIQCVGGYLAEVIMVDNQQLTADSFGEIDEDYGHWKPIKYTGSYGTNGFYLDFADAADLGDDESGNGNDFTETNLTASDQTTDSPTNNFAVMNNLDNYYAGNTYAEGNLKVTTGLASYAKVNGTIGVSSGKWYFEMRYVTNAEYNNDSGSYISVGISEREAIATNDHLGASSDSYGYYSHDGKKLNDDPEGIGRESYGNSYAEGDIVGVAFDLDNNKIYFSKNGTWQDSGDPTSGATGTGAAFSLGTGRTYRPSFSDISGHATGPAGVCVFNFGQDGTFAGNETAGDNADDNGYGNFLYDVPTGFLALCSKNLPEPAVVPSENFEAVIYTGNNATTQAVTTSFEPDMVWNKIRNGAYHHRIFDRVRGFTNSIYTNGNYAENNYTDYGYITGTSATSVTIGQGTHSDNLINDTGNNGVAWNWKANGSGSSNEDGTINTTSTSANVEAGFSIVSYTGNDTGGATVGHGLSVAPEIIILKRRTLADDWLLGTLQPSASVDWTDYFKFHTTDAIADINLFWNDTAPTASVFSVGTSSTVNSSSHTYIAYCFHSVEGYSKIGSYEGNGNTDGTFVYTGFRPAFVMTKSIDSTSAWQIFDSKREGYNVDNDVLEADATSVETTTDYIDILSNGFKSRITTDPNVAESYLYIAFAETPFKYANAR